MSNLTQQGTAALKAGNRAAARELLQRALQFDNNDTTAWLWLAAAVDTPAEREACLREVLRIDPQHSGALRAMQQTQNAKAAAPSPRAEPVRPAAPPPPTPAASSLQPEFSRESLFWPTTEPPRPQIAAEAPPDEPPVFSREALLGPLSELPPDEPPAPAAPARRRPPAKKAAAAPKKAEPGGFKMILAVLGVVVLLFLTGFTAVFILRQAQSPAQPNALPAVEASPTHTPSPSPLPSQTPTPLPTVRPSLTPTPTETYVPIGPTARVQVERIQQEVSNLRGLPVQSTAIGFNIVTRPQAESLLKQRYITRETVLQLEDEQRVLAALGLMTPGDDLASSVVNRAVDGIGGFYLPKSEEIYVIGMRFGGIEHYVYSHEFDHALVRQNFDTHALSQTACAGSSDACTALNALLEGDASMLMRQWWKKYSGPQDYRDILLYRPSVMAFPEQSTPPYIVEDLGFPYEKGLAFVEYLYNLGRWAKVDAAYKNLPATTEQILHPAKYLSGEQAVPLTLPPLTGALGEGWRLLKEDVLGEWSTYLLLAYHADQAAQLNHVVSTTASQGWGGSRYQVYHHAGQDQTALAALWAWDTEKDGNEFAAALRQQLDIRYRGARPNFPGDCWEQDGSLTCVLTSPSQTLWLTAPTREMMENMQALFPDFQ